MRRRFAEAALLLLSACAAFGETRYHYGDDPRWADPQFDDSAWPVAKDNHWPRPPFEGSGFMWIRFHVTPPPNSLDPLAVRLSLEFGPALPNEVWVTGVHVGGDGPFPPHPYIRVRPVTTVFDLPPGTVTGGQTVVIAR